MTDSGLGSHVGAVVVLWPEVNMDNNLSEAFRAAIKPRLNARVDPAFGELGDHSRIQS
jgi:hypothetical protein